MDVKHLGIQNFLTIGSASLALDGRGLLLIQGENKDDSSASSNGAGKSSIVDALCWAIFGTTAREVTGDDVVNDTAKKDTCVTAELVDGALTYKITRYRKHKVHKNQLFVSQNDGTGEVDLSKGTDKETQEVVNKIIGCSLDVFVGSIYAGQEKMPDLPAMTDKQLKLLIEEAAGVEELAEAYAEARTRSATVSNELAQAQAELSTMKAQRDTVQASVLDATTKADDFEKGRADRAKAELVKIKPIETAMADDQKALADIDHAALTTRKGELEGILASRRAEESKLEALKKEERTASDKVTRFRSTLDVQKKGLQTVEKNLADVDAQVGKPCNECGKPYCAHDLETVKAMREDSVRLAKKTLLEVAQNAKVALAEHEAAKKAMEDFAAAMPDVSAVTAEWQEIQNKLTRHSALTASVAAAQKSIETIKQTAKERMKESNPWSNVLATQNKMLEDLDANIAKKNAEIEAIEEKAQVYADAVKVFGPAGVRAHILDTVTPFLNDRTGEYLDALADGNIHAVWSTLSKTSKGDLKEKFNIEVTNDKGGKSFKAQSGGEKRKVRLATAMALQDLVASRAGKPINLFLADEIDDALDEPGLERLMTVLDKKAKERGTVLVISHNSLSDWIDQVITVSKSGGVSTVTGAISHGY